LLYGTGHLLHSFEFGGVNLYERHYPGTTLVIDVDPAKVGDEEANPLFCAVSRPSR